MGKNGSIYMCIQKRMYGLPAAGILANKLLKSRLAKKRYFELPHTPVFWKHVSRPISFTLVVDDFGIKYVGKEHTDHLLSSLTDYYKIENDWEGKLYCGIKLWWDYEGGWVNTPMRTYVHHQLVRYNHPLPKRPQQTPYAPAPAVYGRKAQEIPEPDKNNPRRKQKIARPAGSG